MCRWIGLVVLAAVLGQVRAATVYSRSGQFVIHSPYATMPTLNQLPTPVSSNRVTLAPDPLAVSCERIKTGVLRELDLPDHWRGKVHVRIKPRLRAGATPGFVSTRYADGWQYTLELPEELEPDALVRSVVLAVLSEIANRQVGVRPAEIPIWLAEGLSASAAHAIGPDLVVAPTPLRARLGASVGQLDTTPQTRVGAENLGEVRAWLFDRVPLTFAQLSQPAPDFLSGESGTTYRHCAHLLVRHLQALPQGRRGLQTFVFSLTRSLNWQTAFLEAFSGQFSRLLDVEKWWTVSMQGFLQGDQPNAWSRAVSLDKLGDILGVRVEVQDRPRAPRRATVLSLQEFMGKTEFAVHRAVVRVRVSRLQAIQRSAAREIVPLIESYRAVLDEYLSHRAQAGRSPLAKRVGSLPPALLLREATRQLDELDRRRAQARLLADRPLAPLSDSGQRR
ncbi:MAG: hypothetical protein KA191_04545 [Verrucomicrobia bacterium]|jgi:hypothetical protein|nr:hypothetical protein [Verrucomicrobiota bacterium]OQC67085.1 MAG: hypothetical protein BWX48_01029 [Verrucomicrobia bacterium ADurb.Bin006]MDI9380914.1 hypothetical protein [Verrucomicrobiota bacterium]NMD18961.1 hypothetical protein [Verrucomicrobiota bacterium]HNU99466.1 hypothetical protein [Verrucomicrobiota bacterium]